MFPPQAAAPAIVASGADANDFRIPVLIAHHDDGVRARIRRVLVGQELLVDDVSDLRGALVAAHRNDAFVLVVGAGLLEEAADLSRLADAAGSLTRGALVVVDEADDRIAC
ncbi:MAG TPA: hypothetical protein VGP92_13290, partial [Acidimicrobiia bacterium]|nr:hypothetical protein [Acidimicrobiia bacterium]